MKLSNRAWGHLAQEDRRTHPVVGEVVRVPVVGYGPPVQLLAGGWQGGRQQPPDGPVPAGPGLAQQPG